jgi:hypothetical protein
MSASTPMEPAEYTPELAAPAPDPAIVPPVAMMTTLGRELRFSRKPNSGRGAHLLKGDE